MPSFRMVSVGEDEEISFVCDRCSIEVVESSFDTYNRPFLARYHEEGHCVTCSGTGFQPGLESDLCEECGGTGICPVCGGISPREWDTLPSEAQEEWLMYWDRSGDLPKNHGALSAMYRKW